MTNICYTVSNESKTEYEKIESKCHSKYNRRCINGSITGCGNCVGYCKFSEHPGFLTREQRKEHNCIEKGCYYYVNKPKHNAPKKQISTSDRILNIAISCSTPMEGFRITSALQDKNGVWKLNYVTISNDYPIDRLSKEISVQCGESIFLQQLNCDFDQAVHLIYQL